MTQPRRQDELDLFRQLRLMAVANDSAHQRQPGYSNTLNLAKQSGMPINRLYYILEKWDRKGWWEWGMNAAGGWFTDAAPDILRP